MYFVDEILSTFDSTNIDKLVIKSTLYLVETLTQETEKAFIGWTYHVDRRDLSRKMDCTRILRIVINATSRYGGTKKHFRLACAVVEKLSSL